MLKDGKYAVWFRTSRGQGTGIVHLADGRISGRDSFFSYGGSYQVDDSRFTAELTIQRQADGPQSVFGLDEVAVRLIGVCNGAMATCSGTAERAPDLPFEATLIYSQEETLPEAKSGVVKLKTDRVAKGLDSRLVTRARPRPPRLPGPPMGSAS